jgi:2-amino-4-hydroxy-6-hydroxymethyldihydropteridine diphosphokinase
MTPAQWTPASLRYSNLQQPMQQVRRALMSWRRWMRRSILHSFVPVGLWAADQPPFVNAVAGLLTQLSAVELPWACAIERAGQIPIQHWGPRIIDLDILLHGDTRSDTLELKLPHPGLLQRSFVLAPLAEIAPQLVLPAGITAAAAARRIGREGLHVALDESTGTCT